jgi:hypothetical protein
MQFAVNQLFRVYEQSSFTDWLSVSWALSPHHRPLFANISA